MGASPVRVFCGRGCLVPLGPASGAAACSRQGRRRGGGPEADVTFVGPVLRLGHGGARTWQRLLVDACVALGQAGVGRIFSASDTDDALVGQVRTDIRARVGLDEWLRLGVVRLDEQDCVHLEAQAFVPQKGFDEKAAYLAHNLHDHASAAVHNLSGEGQPFFERSVHYDALASVSVNTLREAVARDGMQTLLSFSRLAADLENVDLPSIEQRQRITIGLYFYTEPNDPDSPMTSAP